MSDQYSANEQQSTVSALWRRASQQLRKLSDQAGQAIGKLTEFEQLKQQARQQYSAALPEQDPMQVLRQHLPELSRQLVVGRFASVSRLATQLMPQELLERLTEQALEHAVQFAALLSGNDALYDELGVVSLHDLRQLDLEQADLLADQVASRNRLLGAAEGAATGLAGFVGAIADLPLSFVIVLRTIYQTAECYGYDLADLDGRQKIYQVLAETEWGVLIEKQALLLSLVSMQQLLDKEGLAGLQQTVGSAGDLEVFEKLVQEVAERFNLRLPDRLANRALPVAGGVVGAFYNTRLINSVAALAQATFRAQRLAHPLSLAYADHAERLPPQTLNAEINQPSAEIAPEISAEAVFGHSAEDEAIKPQPKKRTVRVKKNSNGELTANTVEITPNNDTQH